MELIPLHPPLQCGDGKQAPHARPVLLCVLKCWDINLTAWYTLGKHIQELSTAGLPCSPALLSMGINVLIVPKGQTSCGGILKNKNFNNIHSILPRPKTKPCLLLRSCLLFLAPGELTDWQSLRPCQPREVQLTLQVNRLWSQADLGAGNSDPIHLLTLGTLLLYSKPWFSHL